MIAQAVNLVRKKNLAQTQPSRAGHHKQLATAKRTVATSTEAIALASSHRTLKVGNILINVFNNPAELNQTVAQQLIPEFKKPGLIILPADSTHGHETGRPDGEIYKFVNQHFATNQPHAKLRVTHMDELGSKQVKDSTVIPERFSDKIKQWLPNITGTIHERFLPINPNDLTAYKTFVESSGGARVIVGGVGKDVPPHIAYIGEATNLQGKPVINNVPASIKLRDGEAERRGVTHAVTMGMSFFNSENLEKVVITAKGEPKAKAVLYALRDGLLNDAPDGKSAFGKLIRKFAKQPQNSKTQLVLNFDADAFKQVSSNTEIMDQLKGLRKIKAHPASKPHS